MRFLLISNISSRAQIEISDFFDQVNVIRIRDLDNILPLSGLRHNVALLSVILAQSMKLEASSYLQESMDLSLWQGNLTKVDIVK